MDDRQDYLQQLLSPSNSIELDYIDLKGNPATRTTAEGVVTTIYDENGKFIKSSLRLFKNRIKNKRGIGAH